MGRKKIQKEVTLSCLEKLVENKGVFANWGGLTDIQALEVSGYESDWNSKEYIKSVIESFCRRVDFLQSDQKTHNDFDQLPDDAIESLNYQIEKLKNSLEYSISA